MHEFIKYNIKLKPEVLEELSLTKFKWYMISNNQVLSEPFIEKWSHKLNWVIKKHADKLNWDGIKWNKQIPQEIKDKFLEIYQ